MKENILLLIIILFPYLIKSLEQISIEKSIDEEQENGTIIVDLKSEIFSLSKIENLNGYIIKFVRPCLYLYIDKLNIYSLKLDREKICPYEENECYFICNLFIQKEEIKLIKLKINIKDINDHKPKFKKNFYLFEIEENLSINNYYIQLEQAEDKDLSLQNSIKNYYLNNINENQFPFKLNYDKKNHLLQLILIQKLNFEEEEKIFNFQLIVQDGQNLTDKCEIKIKINKNKNNYFSPEFDLKIYKFFIFNPNETFLGQVQVKNSNNNNKQISYRLISSIENNLFEINQTTGEIFLKKQQRNFIFDQFYEIFIEAFNLNYLSTLTTVQIYFNFTQQFNNNEQENFIQIFIPKLFQKNSNNQNKIFIKENLSIPLTILQLFITSSSSSSSSLEMKTSIEENYFYLKQLDQQSFELILLKSFDYEFIQNIYLDFILNNQTLNKKSIQIIIENLNDCQPFFNQTNYFFHIQENNQIPFLLYTFQAFDQDQLNQTIYQIQTSDENTFSINSTSGEFWILKSFDREMKSNYSLSICAFDGIYRTCSSIFLNILDENDNICQFNSSSLTLTINENLPPNTYLIQIQGFDPDYDRNGTLQYSLSPKTSSYLNINSTTGIIQTSTTNSFDYELIQRYSSLIVACDNINSLPSLCCYLQLYINIIDQNDNLPYLIYPSSINDLFIINYTNKTMPRLKSFDNDIDLINRLINYSIIGGSLNSSITIDYLSGQLYLLSTSNLPLYGTLIISLSSQTNIQLTILIHDNQTDPQQFLMSIHQSSFSSQLFYFISFISIGILLFFLTTIFLIYYFYKKKRKHKQKHDDDPLMNTPSTTTLSARSLSTNKKFYETYYSFGDTVGPGIIHI